MNRATLKLFRMAIRSDNGESYSHFLLISGQDYPIRPVDELVDHLLSHPSTDFIEIGESHGRLYEGFCTRVDLYWLKWFQRRTEPWRAIAAVWRRAGLYLPIPKRKHDALDIDRFYFGSSWWALSNEFVGWFLEKIDACPDWLDWLDNSLNSDEVLFQTLYMASPFAGRQQPILTYIDWSEKRPSPKTLGAADLGKMRSSGKFFARKFEPAVDCDVLDRIDTELLLA